MWRFPASRTYPLPRHPLNRQYQPLRLYLPVLNGKEFEQKELYLTNRIIPTPNKKYVAMCHVPAYLPLIERYRTNISNVSQYLIKDSKLIVPRLLFEYPLGKNIVEILIGSYGCKVCDSLMRVCTCRQYPTILKQDLL